MTNSEPRGALKAELDWEKSVPRCETCRHRIAPRTVITRLGSRRPVVIVPPVCRLSNFYTRDVALCRHWTDHNGGTLS